MTTTYTALDSRTVEAQTIFYEDNFNPNAHTQTPAGKWSVVYGINIEGVETTMRLTRERLTPTRMPHQFAYARIGGAGRDMRLYVERDLMPNGRVRVMVTVSERQVAVPVYHNTRQGC